jgi:hypothetical protein
VNVDRTRHRDAVERQVLIMNAIGGKTGKQSPDKCDKPNDEAQPNHSLTRKRGVGSKQIEACVTFAGTATN